MSSTPLRRIVRRQRRLQGPSIVVLHKLENKADDDDDDDDDSLIPRE